MHRDGGSLPGPHERQGVTDDEWNEQRGCATQGDPCRMSPAGCASTRARAGSQAPNGTVATCSASTPTTPAQASQDHSSRQTLGCCPLFPRYFSVAESGSEFRAVQFAPQVVGGRWLWRPPAHVDDTIMNNSSVGRRGGRYHDRAPGVPAGDLVRSPMARSRIAGGCSARDERSHRVASCYRRWVARPG